MCVYEDDHSNSLIVDKKLHHHPFGTEYAEVVEIQHSYHNDWV